MPAESLSYVCKATVQRHNAKGVLYRHRWPTGAQDLVFPTHAAAQRWAESQGQTYTGPNGR